MRDSAGVEIVEHSAEFIAALPRWTIASEPTVRIDGDTPDNTFTDVLRTVRLSDGRFVVADARQRDLRMFSPSGAFLGVLAKSGRGPGEVGYVGNLQRLPGDSVAFVDPNQRRIAILDRDGRPGAQYTYPLFADRSYVNVSLRMDDGRVLAAHRRQTAEPTDAGRPVYRDSFAVVLLEGTTRSDADSKTARIDTVAVVPDNEVYVGMSIEGGKEYAEVLPLRLGRSTAFSSNGRRVFIGTNETHEIVEYGPKGPIRRIRNGTPARAISDSARAHFRAGFAELAKRSGMPAEYAAEYVANLNRWRIADTFEFYAALRMGTDGTLWAEDTWILPDDARRYVVYDSLGRAIARAELPARVKPLQWSRTELLGTWKDDNDVPHVMVWTWRTTP